MADREVSKLGPPPAVDGDREQAGAQANDVVRHDLKDLNHLDDLSGLHDLWEQTVDAVSDPISIVDKEYRVVAANAAYRRMFGLPDGVISPHLCFVDDGGNGPCLGCPLEVTIQSRAPHMVKQERLVKVGGGDADAWLTQGNQPRWERRVFQRWTYPILSADGSVHRVVEILRDITEQERLRAAREESEALRQADRLKTELLGAVSHELRSPLAAIKGYAETLARYERRLSREERLEFLGAIALASDRLGAVIGRLLLLSRLEAGDDAIERGPVDMGRLAQEAALGVREEEQGRISLEIMELDAKTEGSASLAPLALGDQRRLREALDALIDNALKYSGEAGHVNIVVRGARMINIPASHAAGMVRREGEEEGARRYVEVIVRDDGQGIPHESQASIFEAFHRVDTGLTRAVEGLGLGLAICKRIVALSGGRLWVESALGAGSAFHMLLPAFEEEMEEGGC